MRMDAYMHFTEDPLSTTSSILAGSSLLVFPPPPFLHPSRSPNQPHILLHIQPTFPHLLLSFHHSMGFRGVGHRVWTSEIYVSKLLLRYGICLVHDNRFQGIIARPVTHNFNSHDVVDSVNRVNDTYGSWR